MYLLEAHLVPEGTPEKRLSDYATGIFRTIPTRKGIKKALKRKQIRLDGEEGDSGQWVRPGQLIELFERSDAPPKPLELPLEIVWQDEHLAAVIKPAGLVVSGNSYRTLYNALSFNLEKSGAADALPWPLPAHRLDALTTGLVLVARSRSARRGLEQIFRERRIQKQYQAIVMGETPETGEFHEELDGKTAHTSFRRLDLIPSLQSDHLSWLEVDLHSGRTHQIRKHLAKGGHPILGDQQYTSERQTLRGKGLFLAATRLKFMHPLTGAEMDIHAAPPAKFHARWKLEIRRWNKFNHT